MTDPDTPKTAFDGDDARISAPAALRNAPHILEHLLRLAPATGRALELAAGTGEHAIRFAPALPGLTWLPTDLDPARLASIAAWSADHPAANLLPPKRLDATEPGWAAREGPVELILLVNLLQLITWDQTLRLLEEMAEALAPGGIALLYGPFLRDGGATSAGDAAFHARLQAHGLGLKDVVDVAAACVQAGLSLVETVAMPANNLLLCFEREAPALGS